MLKLILLTFLLASCATAEKCLLGCGSSLIMETLQVRGLRGQNLIDVAQQDLYWEFVKERDSINKFYGGIKK